MPEVKNCLNCMRMIPTYDQLQRTGQKCGLDPTMRVNRRMVCEQWRSDDITAASETQTEKR